MSYRDDAKTFIGSAAQTSNRPEDMRNALCKIEEVGEVRSKLSQLAEAISILTDERDRLGMKLTPVLRPSAPKNEKECVATSPSMTEIGNSIQQAIDRVYAVARSLNSLRDDAAI